MCLYIYVLVAVCAQRQIISLSINHLYYIAIALKNVHMEESTTAMVKKNHSQFIK